MVCYWPGSQRATAPLTGCNHGCGWFVTGTAWLRPIRQRAGRCGTDKNGKFMNKIGLIQNTRAGRWAQMAFAVWLLSASGQLQAQQKHTEQIVANHAQATLVTELKQALDAQPERYVPRTEHFLDDGQPVYINRLIREQSPYLLQHAHNPVNWYPWGEEAFATARAEDKPVFLSIGYATCHWCHVMERESFENEAVAEILNEHFIAIKVDREQLPDVDATYMTVAQMLNGSGGWPLSVFITETGAAFFAGTYMPPDTFSDLLNRVDTVWNDSRAQLLEHAAEISKALAQTQAVDAAATEVGNPQIEAAVASLLAEHDDFQGGFGGAPKFPREPALLLLLEQARRSADGAALGAVHVTLEHMAAGGIHDQLGGGFHRYAVDHEWLVPHFEKMLYTQALLARNYLGAIQLIDAPDHQRTVRRMLDYVLRDMTSPEGGFYSATDADSEGHEGTFFLWDLEQFDDLLSAEDAEFAKRVWRVSAGGNFEDRNILHLAGPLADVAAQMQMPQAEMVRQLDRISETLRVVRETRIAPGLDDKIITAWNGLMITALAEAGDALAEQRYIDAAITAANRVFEQNHDSDGALWRVAYRGRVSVPAVQPDYAFMAEAALALYDVTEDTLWLERAKQLVADMDRRFLDSEQGNYFMGSERVSGAALPVRQKDLFDSTLPSGNSVALRVLARLWWRTGELDYRNKARKLLGSLSSQIVRQPTAFPYMLVAAAELANDESGSRRYAARGKIKVNAARLDNNQIKVDIDIAPGWHINADQPLQDYLIGTRLSAAGSQALDDTRYPAAKRTVLQFEKSELALYEGEVSITATLPSTPPADGRAVLPVVLDLQACNDEVCLAPESLRLNIPLALAAES